MRRLIIFFSILTLSSLACEALAEADFSRLSPPALESTTPIQSAASEDEVPRVSPQEAKEAFDNGEAVIVDVRSVEAFHESHITGALSIPLDEIEYGLIPDSLEKEKWIITYCT